MRKVASLVFIHRQSNVEVFSNVTDMVFLDQDSLLMTYGDRSQIVRRLLLPIFPMMKSVPQTQSFK